MRSRTVPGVPIRNANQFIESLVTFFNSIENELVSHSAMEGMEKDLRDFHRRGDAAEEPRVHRNSLCAHRHRSPSTHHQESAREPGQDREKALGLYLRRHDGTPVSCYFKREQQPSQTMRWVENETELAVYLIDT